MDSEVHWCDWASQPDIRIACTQRYYIPKLEGSFLEQIDPNRKVFKTHQDDLRYTFEHSLVTCKKCLEKINENKK